MNHSNLKKFPNFFFISFATKKWMSASNSPLGITRDFHDNFSPFFIGLLRRDSRSDFFWGNRALLWKIFVEMSFIRRWAWKASEASPRDAKVRIILFFVQKFHFCNFLNPIWRKILNWKSLKKIKFSNVCFRNWHFFAVFQLQFCVDFWQENSKYFNNFCAKFLKTRLKRL